MATTKGRYEPLFDHDNDRSSILEKRSSKFYEASLGALSPVSSLPAYSRTTELLKSRRKKKTLPLDRFFYFCARQPSFIKWAVLVVLSGLPPTTFLLVSLFAIPRNKTIGVNGTYLQTAIWTISSWASFIILYGVVSTIASLIALLCKQSVYLMKFQNSGHALTFRIALMLWASACYAITPRVFPSLTHWVWWLHKVFEFILIALSIFLAQGIVLELLSIRYIQTWLGPRLRRASDELETMKTLQFLVMPNPRKGDTNMISRMYASFFGLRAIDFLYQDIAQGRGDTEKWTTYATILWNDIRDGKESITRWDLDQRLRNMNHDPSVTYELFAQLDVSGDSSVTQEEVEKLVQRVGYQLNLRALAQRGINSILLKLDIILFLVVIIIVVLIYFVIFEPNEAASIKSFLMSISLFGLAISNPLLEFINNCIFVFGKHPYDVGDFIEAKGKKLLVTHIGLTHTNFEEATKPNPNNPERGLVIQMTNMSLTAEMIINWTRTADVALAKTVEKAEEDEKKEKDKKNLEKKEKKEVRELVSLQSAKLKGEGFEVDIEDEKKEDGDEKDKDKDKDKDKAKKDEKKDT